MSFPQYSNIENNIKKTIDSRKGNNLDVSKLSPWIRVSSAYGTREYDGLIISSNQTGDSFESRYGTPTSGGSIGRDFQGRIVQEEKSVRGLRPSPVIEALEVKNGTEGLTRKCSFTIKCFTLGQVELLSRHFLEPRFFALVEWGWNTNLAYQQQAKLSRLGGKVDPICEMISYQNLATLKNKRSDSQGHYDAFLGVVAGGGFEYGDDETFNLKVELVTQGEIPSYLQLHKSSPLGAINSGKPFSASDIEKSAEDPNSIGKGLFMQMYNSLPSGKQIPPIKSLILDSYWTDPINFLNMDKEIRKDVSNELKSGKVVLGQETITSGQGGTRVATTKTGEIVTDANLFSEERFIRMELAWKILNTISWPIDAEPVEGCPREEKMSNIINIDNTICRAHPHIFSTDKKKLFIPNKRLPDFGLINVLNPPSEEDLNRQAEGGELSEEDKAKSIYQYIGKGMSEVDGMPKTNREVRPYEYFPAQVPLDELDGKWYDDTCYPRQAEKERWGYLKYLYINFDFFVSVLEKNGFLAKDVALDILNGISGAVNMYWDFQISERGKIVPANGWFSDNYYLTKNTQPFFSTNKSPYDTSMGPKNESEADKRAKTQGALELQVVDFNFAGIPPKKGTPIAKFQSRGLLSPFIDFNFNVEIAGALANQVMAKRNQQLLAPARATEDKSENFEGLFAKGNDPIAIKLNQFVASEKEDEVKEYKSEQQRLREQSELTAITAGAAGGFGTTTGAALYGQAAWTRVKSWFADSAEDEYKQSMQEYFFSRAGIFSKVIDRENVGDIVKEWYDAGQNNKILTDIVFVGTYADTNLLSQLEEYDNRGENTNWEEIEVLKQNLNNNPGFLPIKMSFSIHGVGGLKVGDIFVVDDLPKPYAGKLFQIMQVEHTLSDSIWVTQVNASLRNVDLSDTDTADSTGTISSLNR